MIITMDFPFGHPLLNKYAHCSERYLCNSNARCCATCRYTTILQAIFGDLLTTFSSSCYALRQLKETTTDTTNVKFFGSAYYYFTNDIGEGRALRAAR
jgi:hypothetical protein